MKTLISALILSLTASVALATPPNKSPKILDIDCQKQTNVQACQIGQAAERKCIASATLEE